MEPTEPSGPRWFSGRERQLGELRQWLASTSRHSVLLVGAGGTGKSQVAAALAAQLDRDEVPRWIQRVTSTHVDLLTFISEEQSDQLALDAALALAARVDPADAAVVARKIQDNPDENAVVSDVSRKVPKGKVEGFTNIQLLLLILTWLVAISLPFAMTQLPETSQAVVANEIAAVGVALVIADKIRKQD